MKRYYVYASCGNTDLKKGNYLGDGFDVTNPDCWSYSEIDIEGYSKEDAEMFAKIVKVYYPDYNVEIYEKESYDVVFNDSEKSDRKGFDTYRYADCKEYIDSYNGTNESYFADYKGGVVSIVNNDGETLYEEEIY